MYKIYLATLISISIVSGFSLQAMSNSIQAIEEEKTLLAKKDVVISISSECIYCTEPIKSKGCCSKKTIIFDCGHSCHNNCLTSEYGLPTCPQICSFNGTYHQDVKTTCKKCHKDISELTNKTLLEKHYSWLHCRECIVIGTLSLIFAGVITGAILDIVS